MLVPTGKLTQRPRTDRRARGGFTVVELLVVMGVIVLLAGILLPALVGVRKTGQMTASMSNMKQIATWMRLYSSDNRETILPSQFDYSANPYPGKVRTGNLSIGDEHVGSWSDILWSVYELGVFPDENDSTAPDYRFDSPDNALYDKLGPGNVDNVLRSSANNTRPAPQYTDPAALPRPFGPGGDHSGYPGYFAANGFFNSTEDLPSGGKKWYVNGQIKAPDQSMYLVDSLAGEVIDDDVDPWNAHPGFAAAVSTCEVDFRYSGNTSLMLFLDAHVEPIGRWHNIEQLYTIRKIRVQELTLRSYTPPTSPEPSVNETNP